MADIPFIIGLIWIFYLAECLVWSRKGVAHFRSLLGRRWRLARPSELAGSAHGGILLKFPFPPLGTLSPAHLPQVAFSPDGISGYVSELDGSVSDKGAGHYTYKDISAVDVKDLEVLVNGRVFARAHSKAGAKELAEFIKKIRGSRAVDRERLIRKQVRGMFARAEIEKRVGEFREEVSLLFVLCNFLWLYLMAGIPAFLIIFGFSRVILPYLGIVVIMHLLIAAETFRAYRALHDWGGYSLLGTLLPSPFNSIRAMDILAKDLLQGYHPFAVALSLLSQERFVAFARQDLARMRHPIYDAGIAEEPRKTDRWYKGLVIASMEEAVKGLGIDVSGFLVPEADRMDGTYLSFCPRCLCLYQKDGGSCADCPGMELVPLKGRTG